MTMGYNKRNDSGVSFTLPQPCFYPSRHTTSDKTTHRDHNAEDFDSFSSDSESSPTSPPSLVCSSTSSSSSSLASSPALGSSRLSSPILDDFLLSDPCLIDQKPTPNQLTAYASSIIRNEAYALLALANRIAPQESAIGEDDIMFPSDGHEQRGSRTNLAFREVVESLGTLPRHGKIVVTGVGKSGIVGKKMVATFNSLGIQSVFLHPLEALHGDLGVICHCSPNSPCDALLLISHSGATAELMRLLPIVRNRVRTLVAVTRDPDSVLARGCSKWLDAGTGADMDSHLKEGGPGEKPSSDEADSALPAPTSSVVTALAVGDALALCVSRLRLGWAKGGKDRRLDFLRCHPGGQLGLELGREGRGLVAFSS